LQKAQRTSPARCPICGRIGMDDCERDDCTWQQWCDGTPVTAKQRADGAAWAEAMKPILPSGRLPMAGDVQKTSARSPRTSEDDEFPAAWVDAITRDDEACILDAIRRQNQCTDTVCVYSAPHCVCGLRFREITGRGVGQEAGNAE
jgi:hypothetical protein